MSQNPFNKIAQEYDDWYEKNPFIYQSELLALKKLVPKRGMGLEIGAGTGRFASKLNLKYGLEPSQKMAEMAFHRGIQVARGIGEALPFRKNFFETVLMVTVSCFLQEVERTFKEVYGILKSDHAFILGLLDKNGAFAQKYISQKSTSPVFKNAKFLSTAEVSQMLQRAGFRHLEIIQTLFSLNPKAVEKPRPGYGKGSFVVIKALKP